MIQKFIDIGYVDDGTVSFFLLIFQKHVNVESVIEFSDHQ